MNKNEQFVFKKRTTKPEKDNKYYIRKSSGGYSKAVQGKPVDKDCDVLSNCVGYAYGRFNEIGDYGSCKHLAPVNAERFMQYRGDCKTGMLPKLGACMVWQKGDTLNGTDGAEHVAIVEEIKSDTEVITSESSYSGKAFYTKTRKKGKDERWGFGSAYKFLGFIYNLAVKDEEPYIPKVGDKINFTGKTHYKSSTALIPKICKPGLATITKIAEGKKHPFHLVRVKESGSSVYGWVDSNTITKL